MRKRGVSPIVSTILLISIVIVLSIIVFLWASKFIGEQIEKFDQPIEDVCNDVNFVASVDGDQLILVNRGNVPIYGVNIKQVIGGTSRIETKIIELGKGSSKNETISVAPTTESVIVIPILLGEVDNRREKKTCPESTGVEALQL